MFAGHPQGRSWYICGRPVRLCAICHKNKERRQNAFNKNYAQGRWTMWGCNVGDTLARLRKLLRYNRYTQSTKETVQMVRLWRSGCVDCYRTWYFRMHGKKFHHYSTALRPTSSNTIFNKQRSNDRRSDLVDNVKYSPRMFAMAKKCGDCIVTTKHITQLMLNSASRWGDVSLLGSRRYK